MVHENWLRASHSKRNKYSYISTSKKTSRDTPYGTHSAPDPDLALGWRLPAPGYLRLACLFLVLLNSEPLRATGAAALAFLVCDVMRRLPETRRLDVFINFSTATIIDYGSVDSVVSLSPQSPLPHIRTRRRGLESSLSSIVVGKS